MKIFCVFLLSFLTQVLSKQWIDPHDMNTNTKKYLKKSASTGDLKQKLQDCNVNPEENYSLIYLKRVINMLLHSADINKGDLQNYRGHIHFTINHEDLTFLKSFSAMQNANVEDLRRLDTILSKSLERSYLDSASDMFLSAQEQVYQLLSSPSCLPVLALSFCLPYIAYNLFKFNFSIWYAFRYFLLMVIMIDFVQRYQQLSQDANEHNMDLKYSLKCDTSKMTWGEYFKFMTSQEDCEKKVVSLLEVFLNQVKSVIIIPLSAAGTGMGQFGSELWKNLPFPWNILIFPIMLIFCVILIAVIMTTMNNTPFKFNLMHLFHLEFGEKKPAITGKTLDKLLDAVNHRPMLQEVNSANYKTPPKRKSPTKSDKDKKDTLPKKDKPAKSVKNGKENKEKKIHKEDNSQVIDQETEQTNASAGNND